jgi:hypothetical protein
MIGIEEMMIEEFGNGNKIEDQAIVGWKGLIYILRQILFIRGVSSTSTQSRMQH